MTATATIPLPSSAVLPPVDPRRWWTLAVIALTQVMVVLDSTVVTIALPSAQSDLGFSDADRQWVITAYALSFGSLLLLGGRLSDLIGRNRTFLIGLAGFALASALGGAAPTFGVLIAARALQGLFGALLAPTALAILTTTFTVPKERSRAFGVFGALAGAGGAIGLLLGGLLTETIDWRWNLYINVPIAIAAFVGGMIWVRNLPRTGARPRLDVPGTILAGAGLFGLVFGFANAERDGWASPTSWGYLSASAALLVGFVLWQSRAAHPLLPLSVVQDRDRSAAYLSVAISGAGMFGIFLFVTYYVQSILGYSPIQTGIAYLPMVAVLVVASQLSTAVLLPRLGPRIVVPVGMLLAATAMVLFTRLGMDSQYMPDLLVPFLFMGAGIGTIMPASMQFSTAGVDHRNAGVASALVNTTQQIGGSVATALLNTLAATAVTDYLAAHAPVTALTGAQAAVSGYAVTYWWCAAFFVAGAVIAAVMFRDRRRIAALASAHGAQGNVDGAVHLM